MKRSLRRRLALSTEFPRAMWELGALSATLPLLRSLPRGDGHRVIVLPGFLASDQSTLILRTVLANLGYDVHAWGLGRNMGPTPRRISHLYDRFDDLVAESRGPVSIVGWSLGGLYARQLAHHQPDAVRLVITLGSPIRVADGVATPLGHLLSESVRRRNGAVSFGRAEMPLPVPATPVYSYGDGVVSWRTCVEPVGPTSESIRVIGSHCGLGHNPAVIRVVADRLAQRRGTWAPYRPDRFARALFFAKPDHVRVDGRRVDTAA